MKILAISDRADKALWDYYTPEKLDGVELILSCGDLDPAYLEFLVTMTNATLLYVRGNHDKKYDDKPPQGCIPADGRLIDFHGIRILGLGGSMRYKPGSDMYTEEEMRRRIRKTRIRLAVTGGFDILMTHAPVKGYGDMEDLPHRGFACFEELLQKYRPAYMLYGHVHREYGRFPREIEHPCGTRIVNTCGHVLLDLPERDLAGNEKSISVLYKWAVERRN